jgi:hypothetical protein
MAAGAPGKRWFAILIRYALVPSTNTRAFLILFMAKCCAKYCRKEAKKGRFCYHHEHENRKQNNPYRYWFGVLRRNAARRGKHFALAFEYWVWWCDETGYLSIKGKHKGDASVDCIINELGYIDGNIRPLTVEDNAEKGVKYLDYNTATRSWDIITWTPSADPVPDDLPF